MRTKKLSQKELEEQCSKVVRFKNPNPDNDSIHIRVRKNEVEITRHLVYVLVDGKEDDEGDVILLIVKAFKDKLICRENEILQEWEISNYTMIEDLLREIMLKEEMKMYWGTPPKYIEEE